MPLESPPRPVNAVLAEKEAQLKRLEAIIEDLEGEEFASLWQDESPTNWVKYVPLISVVLEIVLIIILFVKK